MVWDRNQSMENPCLNNGGDIQDLLNHPIMQMPVGLLSLMLSKELAERDFKEFCIQAWDIVEPGRPLIWGWHLDYKCKHLQAVYNFTVPPEIDPKAKDDIGIQNLIINEPPRCSKSLFTSVLFPAWVWTKWPGARFLCITYAEDLAQRDALKTRQLIESPWYTQRWSISVSEDQSAKKRYNVEYVDPVTREKVTGGYRVSTTILGMATGEGGDFRLIDDPHNVKKALSDVERKQAIMFYDLTLPTRVVDPKRSSTVICMQRLHEDDLTGHALLGDREYSVVCLPMEYETQKGNRCNSPLGLIDPRTIDGELLHPERWDRKSVDDAKGDLRLNLGEFGVNSQFQQSPTPPGGGLFKPRENMIPVKEFPPLHDLECVTRYWDKAGSQDSGAFTAGALLAKHKSTQRTIVLDIIRGQWLPEKRESIIRDTAFQDLARFKLKPNQASKIHIVVEQEGGSGGKESALNTILHTLPGFRVSRYPKRESKEVDWHPWATQVNSGGVEYLIAPWNDKLFKEMEAAPFVTFKDQLDATSGAFRFIWLMPRSRIL